MDFKRAVSMTGFKQPRRCLGTKTLFISLAGATLIAVFLLMLQGAFPGAGEIICMQQAEDGMNWEHCPEIEQEGKRAFVLNGQ